MDLNDFDVVCRASIVKRDDGLYDWMATAAKAGEMAVFAGRGCVSPKACTDELEAGVMAWCGAGEVETVHMRAIAHPPDVQFN